MEIEKQSKRVSVRLRHKIEKKVVAKARKNRKLAKKDTTWKSKLKKDPGIPNLFPYKDRILAEIETQRRSKEEERQRQKELTKEKKKQQLEEDEEEMVDVDEEVEDDDEDSGSEADSGSEDEGDMEIEDEDPGVRINFFFPLFFSHPCSIPRDPSFVCSVPAAYLGVLESRNYLSHKFLQHSSLLLFV